MALLRGWSKKCLPHTIAENQGSDPVGSSGLSLLLGSCPLPNLQSNTQEVRSSPRIAALESLAGFSNLTKIIPKLLCVKIHQF